MYEERTALQKMDIGFIRKREEQAQNVETVPYVLLGGADDAENTVSGLMTYDENVEIPPEIRKSIDAYVENHKKAIEKFAKKLTVEICKDIERYKDEIMDGRVAVHSAFPIEDKDSVMSLETKEAVLSIKTIEWMKEVEKYAVKYKLTSEILESINQCKKQIKAENADWNDISRAVETLLENIGGKVLPENETAAGGMKEVSVQVFKAQIQKVMEKCRTENEAAEKFMLEYGSAAVKKVYGNMQKISVARTYLPEMKNENLYLDFFRNIEKEYDRTAGLLIQGLFRDIAKNYTQILDEMQTVLQSIDEYLPDKESGIIYSEYKEEKHNLDKEMLDKADKLEFGGSEIVLFAQRTKGAVKSITKKWQRKKKMLIFLPIFLLICSILFESIIAQEQIRGMIENVAMNDFMIRFSNMINSKIPWNALSDFLYSIAAFVFMLFTNLKSVMIAALILIGVFFIAYLKFLKYWCDNQICRQCEEYLKIELAQFDNQNTLMLKIEKTVRNAVEEYEQGNRTALEHIFSEIEYGSDNAGKADASWFKDIRKQWEQIILFME